MAYITFPLKDGSEFKVPFEKGVWYEEQFPTINVAAEFCSMLVWLDANPERRKTQRGIYKFVASWLIQATRDAETPNRVRQEAKVGMR